MTVTTKEIFDHMRPNLTTDQVQALYMLMEKGADLDTIGRFAGGSNQSEYSSHAKTKRI